MRNAGIPTPNPIAKAFRFIPDDFLWFWLDASVEEDEGVGEDEDDEVAEDEEEDDVFVLSTPLILSDFVSSS